LDANFERIGTQVVTRVMAMANITIPANTVLIMMLTFAIWLASVKYDGDVADSSLGNSTLKMAFLPSYRLFVEAGYL
jgi:hypothetical protein